MDKILELYVSIVGMMPKGAEREKWIFYYKAFRLAYNRALKRGPVSHERVRFLALLSKCKRGNSRKPIQSRRPKLPY